MRDRPGTLVHPAVPGSRRFTVEDLWRIPRVGGPAPSPDAAHLVVPVTTYTMGEAKGATRLWLADAAGGEPRPLTGPDVTAGGPVWSPDGSRLAFTLRPRDGDEEVPAQLHVLRPGAGEPERVTDLPLGVLDARWLPDGSGLILASRLLVTHPSIEATREEVARRGADPVKARATEERVYRFWDEWLTGGEVVHLLHLDLGRGACRDLTPDLDGWLDFMEPRGQLDVSPDGSEVAFGVLVRNAERNEIESRVYRVPLAGGPPQRLAPDAPASTRRPRYTPDGSAIVYGRTEDRYFYADRARLHRYDRATGEHAPWCDGWDQAPHAWELDAGGTLVFTAERDARTHLYALAPDAREPRLLCEGGTIASPRPAGDGHVYVLIESHQRPAEVHRCPIAGGSPQRLTRFTADALRDVALGEVREIAVAGAEGEPVHAFVVLPPDHDASRPAPLVQVIHGGPHATSEDAFQFRWNRHLFAAPGYVVASPNFQGSTSWGTDFARRIQGAWADRPFRDVTAVTDALVESGLVDARRMAAAGGSYGGYLVAWIAGHTDRFRCLVNHAGVYDLLGMYASDVTQGRARSYGGEPWDGLDAIERWSPARMAAGLCTPMLVIHGERDYRVPVGQGLECYGILKAKGVPARLLYFPDENHWVLKPHNSVRWYQEVIGWLGRWLGSDGATERRKGE